jgi:hypothetical protein
MIFFFTPKKIAFKGGGKGCFSGENSPPKNNMYTDFDGISRRMGEGGRKGKGERGKGKGERDETRQRRYVIVGKCCFILFYSCFILASFYVI